MWSTVRSTAARQLRVSRAAKLNTGLSVSSRVANGSFVVPTSYRLVLSSRSFSETSDQLAAKAAAKPAAKKSTTAAAKKPAAKKASAKKAAPKKAAKAKKPAAKKAAPKKRVLKVKNPEEQRKLEIRELKKTALLHQPKRLPDRAWLVYVSQHIDKGVTPASLGDIVKRLASEYNSLSSSDKARLEITANENRLANDAAYKAWVESHTPIEIDAANRARQRLRKISLTHKRKANIKDDRLPKQALTAFTQYTVSRWQSGDFAGTPVSEASKSIGQEWKSLGAADKKAFEESAAADSARYVKDVKSVLHREVRSSVSP